MKFFEGQPPVDAVCHFCGEVQPWDHKHCSHCGGSMDPFEVTPKLISATHVVFSFRFKAEDFRGVEDPRD